MNQVFVLHRQRGFAVVVLQVLPKAFRNRVDQLFLGDEEHGDKSLCGGKVLTFSTVLHTGLVMGTVKNLQKRFRFS